MSDGPKFTINSADVPAANRIRISADETISTGTFRIESTDGTSWHVVGVDFGSEPSRSVVSVHCARCSATIDPAAVEHHAVCFIVGDYVRWTDPKWQAAESRWFEGTATKVYDSGQGTIGVSVRIERGNTQYKPGDHVSHTNAANLRHIQRPGQADLKAAADQVNDRIKQLNEKRMEHLAAKPPTIETPYVKVTGVSWRPITVTKAELIEATKYDGLTGKECLERYEASQREQPIRAKSGERIFLPLTPVQLAAARELWSLYLKQRISAAKERERLSVTYCEVDVEEEPW